MGFSLADTIHQTSSAAVVSVTNASGTLIAADAERVGIFIGPPAAGYVTVSLANPAVLDEGIKIASTDQGYFMHQSEWGDAVQKILRVIASVVGPQNLALFTIKR